MWVRYIFNYWQFIDESHLVSADYVIHHNTLVEGKVVYYFSIVCFAVKFIGTFSDPCQSFLDIKYSEMVYESLLTETL